MKSVARDVETMFFLVDTAPPAPLINKRWRTCLLQRQSPPQFGPLGRRRHHRTHTHTQTIWPQAYSIAISAEYILQQLITQIGRAPSSRSNADHPPVNPPAASNLRTAAQTCRPGACPTCSGTRRRRTSSSTTLRARAAGPCSSRGRATRRATRTFPREDTGWIR